MVRFFTTWVCTEHDAHVSLQSWQLETADVGPQSSLQQWGDFFEHISKLDCDSQKQQRNDFKKIQRNKPGFTKSWHVKQDREINMLQAITVDIENSQEGHTYSLDTVAEDQQSTSVTRNLDRITELDQLPLTEVSLDELKQISISHGDGKWSIV